jgi:ABC-type branched-subunit amino acid transport system permease subunit
MLPLALIVVILGGSGSLLGTLVGSFIIGFLYNFGRRGSRPCLRASCSCRCCWSWCCGRRACSAGRGMTVSCDMPRSRSHSHCSPPCRCGWRNSYYINIASQFLLFAVFALALNVLVGYAGLVSLGMPAVCDRRL